MNISSRRLPSWGIFAIVLTGGIFLAQTLGAVEWKNYESKKYGFALKVPKQFEINSEDKGVTFIYQPGSAPAADSTSGKKKKISVGARIKGIGVGVEKSEEASASSGGGGGLDSALSIYINWTWMPDVASGTLYTANKKQDQQNIDSPDPDYRDIIDFDKKKGYAHEGNTYWYKEVNKSDPDEIHRWHIKSFGNQSAYTIGLCGVYRQFDEWASVYEEVVKSFKLIPLEK